VQITANDLAAVLTEVASADMPSDVTPVHWMQVYVKTVGTIAGTL